jgi:hypothetical protein
MSFSPVSSFMIVRFLLQVLPRGFPTRNNRLQCNQPVIFDEGHEVDIIVTLDDEDPLTAVSLPVRVLQDVQHVPLSDEEHDLFESDAAVGLQHFMRVFRLTSKHPDARTPAITSPAPISAPLLVDYDPAGESHVTVATK